jgi:hypothetical protein
MHALPQIPISQVPSNARWDQTVRYSRQDIRQRSVLRLGSTRYLLAGASGLFCAGSESWSS